MRFGTDDISYNGRLFASDKIGDIRVLRIIDHPQWEVPKNVAQGRQPKCFERALSGGVKERKRPQPAHQDFPAA